MNITDLEHEKSRGNNRHWILIQIVLSIMVLALLAWPTYADDDKDEQPFGATSVIIELTDNDIELQVFVDGFLWDRLQMYGPSERRIFNLRAKRNFRRQGGLSELFFASEPTHYLVDDRSLTGRSRSSWPDSRKANMNSKGRKWMAAS